MKSISKILLLFIIGLSTTNCISNKKLAVLQEDHDKALNRCMVQLDDFKNKYDACNTTKERIQNELSSAQSILKSKDEQISDLKDQIKDCKEQRDKQSTSIEGIIQTNTAAQGNINKTLEQLEDRDKYIRFLQAAKNKTDSMNLALAINLKGVLKEGIEDNDVEIKVDKTVVFINLSDKMLFQSGSSVITSKANDVLGKIAAIVNSRPDFEVMVEGYTDNVPIKSTCLEDNWDLSVKRSTSVVRVLQTKFNIDPNRLIAAGRGQYNTLTSNDTAAGRATNRRTRIIILPKLDQFYDLLNPDKAVK